jgi:hypothetical protein
MISKSRYLAVVLSAFVFFSCKKDDTSTPTPPEPTLFEKAQGRWDAAVEVIGRVASPSNASHKSLYNPHVTSVEFFEDSSYILVFNYDEAYHGKLSVIDSTSFDFKGFGAISDIQITDDSISFNCVYDDEIPVSVKAGKVSDITVSNEQKSLLKTWVMTTAEDGESYYNGLEAEEGDIKFLFTSAGLALRTRDNGESWSAENWKWHTDIANAVVLYDSYDNEISYNYYYKIIELTSSKLKVEETTREPIYNDNQELTGYNTSVIGTYIFAAE